MRMRRKKHGTERIAACSALLVDSAESVRDFWDSDDFSGPRWLEIGCGKGSFAVGTAGANPDARMIAVEKIADVCCLALEKAMAAKADPAVADNLRFVIGDAAGLKEFFRPGSIDRIYLNFSDPWPKKGYAKRRLTHRNFLALYRELLVPGGELWLKTDNMGLFDFSLEEFAAMGLDVRFVTKDFHHTPEAEGNVMTEYEALFSSQGQPIACARVTFPAPAGD